MTQTLSPQYGEKFAKEHDLTSPLAQRLIPTEGKVKKQDFEARSKTSKKALGMLKGLGELVKPENHFCRVTFQKNKVVVNRCSAITHKLCEFGRNTFGIGADKWSSDVRNAFTLSEHVLEIAKSVPQRDFEEYKATVEEAIKGLEALRDTTYKGKKKQTKVINKAIANLKAASTQVDKQTNKFRNPLQYFYNKMMQAKEAKQPVMEDLTRSFMGGSLKDMLEAAQAGNQKATIDDEQGEFDQFTENVRFFVEDLSPKLKRIDPELNTEAILSEFILRCDEQSGNIDMFQKKMTGMIDRIARRCAAGGVDVREVIVTQFEISDLFPCFVKGEQFKKQMAEVKREVKKRTAEGKLKEFNSRTLANCKFAQDAALTAAFATVTYGTSSWTGPLASFVKFYAGKEVKTGIKNMCDYFHEVPAERKYIFQMKLEQMRFELTRDAKFAPAEAKEMIAFINTLLSQLAGTPGQ